jgi:hypothetical protein
VSAGALLAGAPLKNSFRVGFSLAQIGEFSFVIAALGVSSKLTSEFLYPLAVAVSSLTTFLTPYMIRYSDALVERGLAVTPDSLKRRLDRYRLWVEGRGAVQQAPETIIFSKYLIRLVMYVAVFAGYVLLVRTLLYNSPIAGEAALWTAMWMLPGLLSLPLILAIAQYINHILLLLATSWMAKSKKSWLFKINIHSFYNVSHALTVLVLIFLQSALSLSSGVPTARWAMWSSLLFAAVIAARVAAVKRTGGIHVRHRAGPGDERAHAPGRAAGGARGLHQRDDR